MILDVNIHRIYLQSQLMQKITYIPGSTPSAFVGVHDTPTVSVVEYCPEAIAHNVTVALSPSVTLTSSTLNFTLTTTRKINMIIVIEE